MKAQLYSSKGEKKSQVELPKIFSVRVRADIVKKYFEADKFIQPYMPKPRAGLRQSATGTISHQRHDWKGHYGRGISRAPRKTMRRRGTQFFWVGANVPGTRGGRQAHPPKGIGVEKKINKKEIKLAFESAFAATANKELITKRYSTLGKIEHVPFVVESLPAKTKELKDLIKNIFGENSKLAFKNRETRAGRGSMRGRKYKSNAGVLILTGEEKKIKLSGFDIKSIKEVSISDFYPLGRLTIYTQKALESLNKEIKETKK
ncbi:MAG: 50S ribosomal protein L4 [Nanoarchaeota archaeon]|nr:50S ribosomal protein L4 [Nanoarchaeota archaeon]MBU0977776.1 50S ribosomal protein L4 [Nanoarchaeota archaeon]